MDCDNCGLIISHKPFSVCNVKRNDDTFCCQLHCMISRHVDCIKSKCLNPHKIGSLFCSLHERDECIVENCKNKKCSSRINQLASLLLYCEQHCAFSNHGHCVFGNCNERENLHDGDYCEKHCKITSHGHCTQWPECPCDKCKVAKKCVLCNDSTHAGHNVCKKHCDMCKTHCWFDGCESGNLHEDGSCKFHCNSKYHGHCADDCCSNASHLGIFCKAHCNDKRHGHCSGDDCSKEGQVCYSCKLSKRCKCFIKTLY